LLHEPHIKPADSKQFNEFGYLSQFNGVAVYAFVSNGNWYVTVMEDLGIQEISYDLMKTYVKKVRDGRAPGC